MLIDGQRCRAQDRQMWTHAHVANDMSIAKEEIFGPVLAVIPFTENHEPFGSPAKRSNDLDAAVWTADVRRAIRMTKVIRGLTIGINRFRIEPHAAFGCYRQSGLGRESGRAAIEAYTELKTAMLPFTVEMV